MKYYLYSPFKYKKIYSTVILLIKKLFYCRVSFFAALKYSIIQGIVECNYVFSSIVWSLGNDSLREKVFERVLYFVIASCIGKAEMSDNPRNGWRFMLPIFYFVIYFVLATAVATLL